MMKNTRTRFIAVVARWLFHFAVPAVTVAQTPSQRLPPGRLVDIGGYKLHIQCEGTRKAGRPTVVLMHGLSGYSFDWALVQPPVARFARVCSYDRAGQAWSDPGPAPRGLQTITRELHALLQRSGERGPFVLVGHSWGGLIPRMYFRDYRDDVAGIVFVDASNEEMNLWVQGKTVYPFFMTPNDWNDQASKVFRDAGAPPPGSAVMIKKSLTEKVGPPFDKLPPDIQQLRVWATSQPRDARRAGGGDWGDVRTDLVTVAATDSGQEFPLEDLPVIVLSGTQYNYTSDDINAGLSPTEKMARKFRADVHLARLSRNSKVIVAKSSGHYIHLDQPQLVIDAIRDVIEAAQFRRVLR